MGNETKVANEVEDDCGTANLSAVIPRWLYVELKVYCARAGRQVKEVVETALAEYLSARPDD